MLNITQAFLMIPAVIAQMPNMFLPDDKKLAIAKSNAKILGLCAEFIDMQFRPGVKWQIQKKQKGSNS